RRTRRQERGFARSDWGDRRVGSRGDLARLARCDRRARDGARRDLCAADREADVILRVERVRVKRGARVVLDDLELGAAPGEIVGVVGKNGSGKSTLLMTIAGVLAPSDGRVLVDDASVWGVARDRMRARKALGYVPEGADPPGFLLAGELWALCAASRGT